MDSLLRFYKIIIGFVELFFGIPFIGGAIIIGHAWAPLGALIFFHFIGLVLSFIAVKAKSASVFGIIGNIIAFIPVVGMIMHILIGLVNVYQGIKDK
ncbi:hypothetical protein MXL46_20650 [Heyndrickxia sporothermodurans]|uniref:Uncharacterized protein n=1 Tax=Heyndrickxia sporothermodurans TaxID=46224 RepID=A0A150L8N2_9BACI|nr:hypothetical protein [Heyndrickxia sporothermodurans]KYD08654.1 hypothetical protein B4102_0734 [Heyndrickxia sporothermodurans]MBL5768324.1 hypothetical protein [Heyndrickxia sporothermodurans]MBL5771968.1 hypothetical protein [Heyndrickxia sporothermodurans]MBL5775558.1 hypothetical protein [Heyndrickxia sporothermodurans]MBL5779080.1 hypothetical protein [Heyndrickxia sporothermodurans]